jgi:hypothetical protein
MRHIDCCGHCAGLRTLWDVPAKLTIARQIVIGRSLREDIVRIESEQRHRTVIAADERACAIRQVAELVRIDGDRVGLRQSGDRTVYVGRGEGSELRSDSRT